MKVDLKTGATIASAVALLLGASPARAADDSKPAKTSAKKVKCLGTNDCKGKGSCSGAGNDCGGKNDCKGKGWTEMSKSACKKAKGKVLAAKDTK